MAGLNAGAYAGFGVGQYNPYAYSPAAPPAPAQAQAQAPPSPPVPTSTQHQNSGNQTIGGNMYSLYMNNSDPLDSCNLQFGDD